MKTVDRGKQKKTAFTYISHPKYIQEPFLGTKRWSPETSAGSEAPPYPSPSTYRIGGFWTQPFHLTHPIGTDKGRGSGRMENP